MMARSASPDEVHKSLDTHGGRQVVHCIFDQAVIGLSWPVVREGMVLDDPAPFANHDPLIGVHAGDGLPVAPRAVRPADRQIRFVAWPMPKCTRKSPWEMWYPPLRTSSISFRPPTLSVNRAPIASRPDAVTARMSSALPLGPKFFSREGGSKRLTTTISCDPSLLRSPT